MRITQIHGDTLAHRMGLRPGDRILSINGEPVLDAVDFLALSSEARLKLEVQRGGARFTVHSKNPSGAPLGVAFETAQDIRRCENACVFCFVDQLPDGMRDSLYIKDDDWRESLSTGNFVTLTNVDDAEFDRILRRRAAPLFISVHALDGAVRSAMMRNREAARIRERLTALRDNNLAFHAQIVLCPGCNDGAVLAETLEGLSQMRPAALSVAVVPLGMTAHREGLTPLTPVNRDTASAAIDAVERLSARFHRTLGTRFCWCADELYQIAGRALPPARDYEDYPQLANGVGLLRLFEEEFRYAMAARPQRRGMGRLLVVTGTSAKGFLETLCGEYPIPGVSVTVQAIKNRFFGTSVTVAGLVTGGDIIEQVKPASADRLLIPRSMLRYGEDVFLDNTTVGEVSQALNMPVTVVETDGAAFAEALCGGGI